METFIKTDTYRFFFTYPSSELSIGATTLPSVCAHRTGTVFGIPCFHTEFSVIHGVKVAKNAATRGIPGTTVGKVAKNAAIVTGRTNSFRSI